jgi:hypothetical protein
MHRYDTSAIKWGWTQTPGRCFSDQKSGFSPDPDNVTGNASIALVSGGPNDGLSYVSGVSTNLYLRTQLLKDVRTDADAYWLYSSELLVSGGCHNAGLISAYPNVDSVRLQILVVDTTCMHAAGGKALVSFLGNHESCHMAIQASMIRDTVRNVARLDSN